MTEKLLFVPLKTESEKIEIIKTNVLKMLSKRIYIDKNGKKNPLIDFEISKNKLIEETDNTFKIMANNNVEYVFKIIFKKISKLSSIMTFLSDYVKSNKIIIATSFSNNIEDSINSHGAQIFEETALLQNIIDYVDQPLFEVLSPTEVNQLKTEYNITNYTIKKILKGDPITKYYGLKKGNVLEITRVSPASGKNIDYREVQ